MSSIRFGRVLRVVLLSCAATVFPLSRAFASCSSTVIGLDATVTCTAATDQVVISQFLGVWYHTGTSTFGIDQYDWDSSDPGSEHILADGTITFASLGGGSLTIGDAITAADALNGSVTVSHTGAASAQITLDSTISAFASTYTIDDVAGTIIVNALSFDDASTTGAALTIIAGSDSDTVNIQTVFHTDTVTVQGNDGADVVTIGKAGSVQGIGGMVTVKNTGNYSQLTIDDSADGIGRTATVVSGSITGIAPAAINWLTNDISGLILNNGQGDDTVNVNALAAANFFALTIQGTDGIDDVNIGSAGSVQGVMAPVAVKNTLGMTQLTIDDAADATGREAYFTATGVSGIAPAVISWKEGDVDEVAVNFGSGNDLVHLVSTPTGALNSINLGNGSNRCSIFGSGLHASSTNDIYGGSGDDVFTISAATATGATLYVAGGSQAVGDEIIYTSGTAAGAFPGNGTLVPTDVNAHSIAYNSIEAFSIDDGIFADGF